MIAQTNGKSECPLLFALSKTSSKPNFVKYSLTQAMVPIGTDLLSFGSRTNVLSRKCFCVTTELIRSGHFYLTSSIQYRYLFYIRSCRAQVKRQIYADLKLADALINDRAVDWTYINGNYHMNFGYSASRLIDTVVFFKILEEVKHQFTYESANYLKGKDQFYKPLDYDGKDKSLIDQFVKTLSDLKLVRTYGRNNETGLKGQCIKYFQNICDYHAKE